MLKIVRNFGALRLSDLMAIYAQSCTERGRILAPLETPAHQKDAGERDFYEYLTQTFFCIPGAEYELWQVDDRYVSALRTAPYRDGLLFAGLETAPAERRRGYASALIRAVLARTGKRPVYSHVKKGNAASRNLHLSCGFERLLDYAVLTDGTVSAEFETFIRRGDC